MSKRIFHEGVHAHGTVHPTCIFRQRIKDRRSKVLKILVWHEAGASAWKTLSATSQPSPPQSKINK